MVRRGSTVRVRQRALLKALQMAFSVASDGEIVNPPLTRVAGRRPLVRVGGAAFRCWRGLVYPPAQYVFATNLSKSATARFGIVLRSWFAISTTCRFPFPLEIAAAS